MRSAHRSWMTTHRSWTPNRSTIDRSHWSRRRRGNWTHRGNPRSVPIVRTIWRNPGWNWTAKTNASPHPRIVVVVIPVIVWTIYIVVVAIAEGRDGCRDNRRGVNRCNWCGYWSSNNGLSDHRSSDHRSSDHRSWLNHHSPRSCQSSTQTKSQTAEDVPCHPMVPAMMTKCRQSDKHSHNHNHLLHLCILSLFVVIPIYQLYIPIGM